MKTLVTRIGRLGLVAGVIAAGVARPAAAQSTEPEETETVRESRPGFVAFSPVYVWHAAHDFTVPMPASLRVSVNVLPRLALDLTGAILPVGRGTFGLVDLGARWFFLDGNASPYLMGRAGKYWGYDDEGPDPEFSFVTLGAGVEYAADNGFTTWFEVGPALLESERGWYSSFGLGYRLGTPPE